MPAEPISLYIDLEPGQTAELEVVAQAALEFAAGVREVAFLFDPSFEFRLELQRGDEGSLWLKAFIRWIRGVGHAHPTMTAVVAAAASWFALETGSYTYEKALDYFLKSKDPEITRLVPEQIEEIAKRVATIANAESPAKHFRGVYRELGKDKAVRGVGVSAQHDHPPTIIVPRSVFEERAGETTAPQDVGATRERVETGDYVIVRAILKEGGGRWRLRGPHGEFSATITDERFNDAIQRGTAPVPLAAEIHMRADVKITEEIADEGAWKPTKYEIFRVDGVSRAPTQPGLFPPGERQP